MTIARVVTVDDLRQRARKNLPKAIFEFIDGGANDELTLRANRSHFADIDFAPRTLVDVSERRQSTRILGQDLQDRSGKSFVVENRAGAGGNMNLAAH